YSHSHPMFGSVSQWFINWLGGIQPAADAVGFDRIVIRPQAVKDVNWVRSSYNSARGRIVSNWKREGGQLKFEVNIPANTTALIYLPARTAEQITENGKPISQVAGIKEFQTEQNAVVCRLGSGSYSFTVNGKD
ncbi:MAG: glycoside hydrolase family 78, partial [Acidobacteria bacterium]